MQVSSAGHSCYQFGEFTLDVDRGALLKSGEEISLRPKAFEVLRYLVSHQGTLVTRDNLLSAVWPDVVVTDDSLTQCLIEIRRALGDHDRSLIRTIPRRGFIFEPAVEHRQPQNHVISRHASRSTWLLAMVFVLLMAAAGWWLSAPAPPAPPDSISSTSADVVPASLRANAIAVLDFDDLSPAKDQQWFAEGLSEEIRNLLASTPGLEVIGRSSSSAAGIGDRDLRAIGRTLHVRHLLEGSVRMNGHQVRIGVQLIDATDGTMTWSGSHDGTMGEVFALQDEVAAATLDALKLHIGTYPSRGRPTRNPEAYALLLKARLALNVQEGIAAEENLQRAVELDPNFAEAWELLAHTHWTQPRPGLGMAEMKDLIREAAGKALAVDPTREFSRALFIEGSTNRYLTADVLDAYVVAATRQPNNPAILRTLSWNLLIAGYLAEGLEAAQRLVDIDPLSSIAHIRHAAALVATGTGEESLAALQTAHRLSVEGLEWYLGEVHLAAGNRESAIASFTAALSGWGVPDSQWLEKILDGVREGSLATDFSVNGLPFSAGTLTLEQVNFITTGLNRWHLLTGNIDHYYRIILDPLLEVQLVPNTEYYLWYGIVHRNRGFTAHPLFLEIAARMGLTQVWEQRGPPDFCSKSAERWICF